ncbi:MAG: hypothetical protein DRP29_02615 [Thermodesulfobacteriota bacterium]|nr:MAG: hypothetical protein DRP29_02615 [Thermodesulfobacteriota bacterium]RLB03549.1 MAG: hypothetical protein DRG83_06835 [Deltaproteobacteria bacterium]
MAKNVIVLGIHDGHNSGAAIVKNGKVLAAISEERLRNIKNYSGTPELAIKTVFKITKIDPRDIDLIVIACLIRTHPPLIEEPFFVKLYRKIVPWIHGHWFSKLYVSILHKFRKMNELKRIFKELKIEDKEIIFVEHHLTHAACAYYTRPWNDKTLVLTLDGSGDGVSSTVNIGEGFRIKRIAWSTSYDSIGNNLYSEITGYLGLKRWEHEYKVMGLAPFGRPEFCINKMRKIVRINPKKPLEFQNTIRAYTTDVQKKLIKMLHGQRFDNIAAACQKYYEELVAQWVKNAIKETGIRKVACAGGMFLNIKANKLLRELDEVEDIYFYPPAGDEGTPVGAALEGYYRYCEREGIEPKRYPLESLYLGRKFDSDEIKLKLKEKGLLHKAKRLDDVAGEVAELISKGKIIGIFWGRDEFGPRALGNRSIVADPRDLKIISKLNFAIKQRDFWMPFAPSILEEKADKYLIDAKPARYMIEAFDTKPEADEIIAGLHQADRTCRPQTVNLWNPRWRRLIEEFERLTGVSGVVNTSFNLHGYPIVGSPEIAIDTFLRSGLDGLVLEDWLILK